MQFRFVIVVICSKAQAGAPVSRHITVLSDIVFDRESGLLLLMYQSK
jgi:hypothetical protein